ncbi:carbon-nitrogen hydrolase family protein [Candidatus Sororendozoicomonas aggregata]|uniref:carbon-nitrogen hydrolase family protein n=1 Tax=Candidatus Sororendozoicomonas aggregata TaxID=3073239 RepID=UPI002ED516BF
MNPLQVSLVQLCSSTQVNDNLNTIELLLKNTLDDQPDIIVLPESFSYRGKKQANPGQDEDTLRQWMSHLATTYQCWLIGGTIPCQLTPGGLCRASCFVYSPQGKEICHYDKIHLFDVDVGDEKGAYRESNDFCPGSKPTLFSLDTPEPATVGLSVCYDLRFPELYRLLTNHGAHILSVPSAFTHKTGQAHWEILLRARAIENQCFVLGANQGGVHSDGTRTWGHSMIVDPWGNILAQARKQATVVSACLNFNELLDRRSSMPCLKHQRLSTIKIVPQKSNSGSQH